MQASSGKTAVTCGVIACYTGVGIVIGIPLIIIGIFISIFGSKPTK